MRNKVLFATDLGGVILDNRGIGPGDIRSVHHPGDGYLTVPPIPGALEGLKQLRDNGFPEIHVISKVVPDGRIRGRHRNWLEHHGFNEIVPQERVHFCDDRGQKTPICQELGVTDFADDRLGVFFFMWPKVERMYLFSPKPGEEDNLRYLVENGSVRVVNSWPELATLLIARSS